MPRPPHPLVVRATAFLAVLVATLTAQAPSGASDRAPAPADLAARVDAVVARHLQRPGAVGLSVGVGRGGRVLHAAGQGLADAEFDVAADAATMFRIGSVTKQFTAALILRAAERGQLALDDPLRRHVPAFDTGERTVTIRQLLDHTSGIPSYTDIGAPFESRKALELEDAELTGLVAGRPFDFEPGANWRYNNTGYYLLGMVLQHVHGKSYAQIVVDELCRPLDLSRTRYDSNRELIKNRAQGYGMQDGVLVNDDLIGMSQPGAAGGLLSTGGDLVRWSMALHGGKVVAPESLALMTKATVLPDGRDTHYGFGLVLGELAGRRTIGHGGGIDGFNSMLLCLPDDDLHIAVISNGERLSANRVAEDLAHELLGIPRPEAKDLPVPAERVQAITGAYRIDAIGLDLRLTARDGKPVLQGEGQRAFRLLWQGGEEFRAEFDPMVRIVFAADGRSFTLYQSGGVFQAVRAD